MKFPRAGIGLFIVTFSFFLTGCSVMQPVGDFFTQRYINTVSYYNTFYNAQKLFDEAVEEAADAEKRHRQQNRAGQVEIPQQVKQKFNDVIEKCSRLLHQYPASKYADDAVLMIGNSYYHMRQNVQAERKYLELLAEFPDSRYIPEAQLLLAKTQRRMNKLREAEVALQNLVERLDSHSDRDVVARARIELGEMEKQAGNLNNAIEEFSRAIEIARDRTIRTEARYYLAYMYYELEHYDKAFDEFTKVVDDRPTSRILFESQQSRARILTINNKHDTAIDMLAELLSDLRLTDYVSRIELEAAHIYRDKGLIEEAIEQYKYVDTTYTRTVVSTEAQYSLAEIYNDIIGDFKKSKDYFETVSRATPPSDLTRSAWTHNDNLTRYWRHKNEIIRLDSVIVAQKERLHQVEEELAALAEVESADVLESDTTGLKGSDTLGTGEIQESAVAVSPEELQNQIASDTDELVRNYYELAGLFYIEMDLPDSAAYYYSRLAYNFSESQYAPQALYALAEIVRLAYEEEEFSFSAADVLIDSQISQEEPQDLRDSIYRLLIDRYPDTEFAIEAKRILGMEIPDVGYEPLEEMYLRAEDAMLAENYEDALYLFDYIAADSSDSKYAVQARYALGWIYENVLLKPDSAAVYYQKLVDTHPDSQFASAVRDKINAWNAQIAEEERARQEEEAVDTAEQQQEEPAPEAIDEEPARQRGIPLARPSDVQELEEKPDTTRIEEQNEN